VSGPNLVAPAGDLAESFGLPPLAGTYLLTLGFIGLAGLIAFIFLRPEPYRLADTSALAAREREAPVESRPLLTIALFLLGYGWNLGFVAGSSLLTSGLSLAERTRVQGVADGVVWSSAALSSLSSGVIVAGASYTALGLLGLGLLIPPAALLLARRGAVAVGRPA
jgi:hypothetical protein